MKNKTKQNTSHTASQPSPNSPKQGEGKEDEKELSASTDSEQYLSRRAKAAFIEDIVTFFFLKNCKSMSTL